MKYGNYVAVNGLIGEMKSIVEYVGKNKISYNSHTPNPKPMNNENKPSNQPDFRGSDSLIMNGTLHTKVEIIKYDGSNKDYIIKRLSIKEHTETYFKTIPSYFIIPDREEDWFILDEVQFKRKITVD